MREFVCFTSVRRRWCCSAIDERSHRGYTEQTKHICSLFSLRISLYNFYLHIWKDVSSLGAAYCWKKKQKKHHRFVFYFLFTVNLMEIAYKSARAESGRSYSILSSQHCIAYTFFDIYRDVLKGFHAFAHAVNFSLHSYFSSSFVCIYFYFTCRLFI